MTKRRSLLLSFGFLGFLGVVAVIGLWVGTQVEAAILESRAGQVSTFSVDPNEPGFRAFTTSSDTALVLHTAVRTGGGADLLGATLLTGAGGDAGGSVVTIPRTFVDTTGSSVPLNELFNAHGLDAVVDELSNALAIGFGDVVVLDASSWTGLMLLDLPLTLSLRDDLVAQVVGDEAGATEVLLESGTEAFDLTDIALIAAHRNPGEPSLGVALRQQQIWRAWISRTAGAAERPDLFEQQSGFADLIGALANAEVSYRTIATTTVTADNPENTIYEGTPEAIADLIAQIVPFPEPVEAGDRPSVLLLDTSLGQMDEVPVVSAVTRSGGLVTILGNSDGGTSLELEVQVHDESALPVAQEIAERLGYRAPRVVLLEDATTAITVIAG